LLWLYDLGMKTITLCQARRLEVATWKTRTGRSG
jgi:hypothetical protein